MITFYKKNLQLLLTILQISFVTALFQGCSFAERTTQKNSDLTTSNMNKGNLMTIPTITASKLKNKLDKNEIVLIDVREPAEHRSEYIQNSQLIPLDTVNIETLPKTKKPFVFYCRSGRRSAEACLKLLHTNSSLNLTHLEGGIIAWKEAGFEVEKSGSNILPLDRQTQLTVGFIAFSGTILGTFVNPLFYILPGFIGAGLMFAGITGWCGMAKLLAKMPWNQ